MSVHPEPPGKQAWEISLPTVDRPECSEALPAEAQPGSSENNVLANKKLGCSEQTVQADRQPAEGWPESSEKTEADRQPGCLDFLEQWLTTDGFTGHGIPRLFEGRMIQRMFWFVLVCIALGFICDGTSSAISDYMNRPFATSIAINITDEIPFPAVTICPSHQLRPNYNPTSDLRTGGFRDKLCNASLYILDFGFGDSMTSKLRNEAGTANKSWSIENARKVEEHWQFRLIASSSSYGFGGSCATFNGNGQYMARAASEFLDVSLSVMTTCNKSVSGLPPEDQGFVVLLHDPSEKGSEAILRSRGIVVGPRERSLIRFRPSRRTQTSEPITPEGITCRGGSYRRDACLDEKKWKAERDLCGCASPPPSENIGLSCYAEVDAQAAHKCLRAKGAEILSTSFKGCPDSCNKLDFPCTRSHFQYPSQEIADALWQYMTTTPLGQEANLSKHMTPNSVSEMMRIQMLQQLVAKVLIGPSDISTEEISVDLKYPDISALLSSIGGCWGFWLGFSIVTFAELCLTPFVVADRLVRGRGKDL